MSPLAVRVRRTIRRYDLIPRGARVLVGVSGGADSVALLHLLLELQRRGDLHVCGVGHVHHGLRGDAADGDEAFCRQLAAALGLPAYVERIDVLGRAQTEGRSIEDAARRARYEALHRAMAVAQADRVGVGHTRDDQAETVVLKLVRGAGTRGLSGIHPRVGSVVRPLLDVGRDELRAFLSGEGVAWREDETNEDLAFRRNAVRHCIAPVVRERFGSGAWTAVARHAELAREDEAFLASLTAPLVARLVRADEPNIVLDCLGTAGLAAALQRRVALETLRLAGVTEPGLDHAIRLLGLLQSDRGEVRLPCGVRGIRKGAVIELTRLGPPQPAPSPFRYELDVPGSLWVPEAGRVLTAAEANARDIGLGALQASSWDAAVIDADRASARLTVRSWKHGDAIRPLGLSGRKKLQDLFVDRKTPRAVRRQLPLVLDRDDRIIWVPGHGIDESFRVTSGTRAVVVLTMRDGGGRE
jgi:tRNA(Ile)-lysidine synthase